MEAGMVENTGDMGIENELDENHDNRTRTKRRRGRMQTH